MFQNVAYRVYRPTVYKSGIYVYVVAWDFNVCFLTFSDVFEYHLNEKVVYSKRLLKRWPGQKGKKGGPDFEELIEITYWMEQVIYLIYLNC